MLENILYWYIRPDGICYTIKRWKQQTFIIKNVYFCKIKWKICKTLKPNGDEFDFEYNEMKYIHDFPHVSTFNSFI